MFEFDERGVEHFPAQIFTKPLRRVTRCSNLLTLEDPSLVVFEEQLQKLADSRFADPEPLSFDAESQSEQQEPSVTKVVGFALPERSVETNTRADEDQTIDLLAINLNELNFQLSSPTSQTSQINSEDHNISNISTIISDTPFENSKSNVIPQPAPTFYFQSLRPFHVYPTKIVSQRKLDTPTKSNARTPNYHKPVPMFRDYTSSALNLFQHAQATRAKKCELSFVRATEHTIFDVDV